MDNDVNVIVFDSANPDFIEILNECGADGWVEKYEKELTELS
jgi:hypothetical protein